MPGEDGATSQAEEPASGPEWFAVYTKSRHEKLVNDGLEALGFETYLPLMRQLRRWSDRNKRVEVPLFPGYLFVRCTEVERPRAFAARGIVRFVTAEGRAVPIPPAEIDAIREVLRSDVPVEPHPKLTAGQPVRVTGGPFRGFSGKLVRRGRKFRLVLAVSAIGQGISVEVDAADVKPE